MNEMKELISKLREADHAYYDLDEPIMSDREYNRLFEKLEQMEKETGIIMSDSPTQRVQGTVLSDFGQTMQDNLVNWFADQNNLEEWRNLLKELNIEKPAPKPAAKKLPLAGLTIVPTGTLENFTRSGIKTAIEMNGGKCGSSVSRNTNYVLVGDKPGSKYTKGKSLGIPMLTEQDFLDMIK